VYLEAIAEGNVEGGAEHSPRRRQVVAKTVGGIEESLLTRTSAQVRPGWRRLTGRRRSPPALVYIANVQSGDVAVLARVQGPSAVATGKCLNGQAAKVSILGDAGTQG